MRFLSINNKNDAENIDKIIESGNIVFILVYMEGCGPCNMTRPEWSKIKPTLEDVYRQKDNIYVVDVNKDYLDNITKIGSVDGFPTMKYINNNGRTIEDYNNNRDIDSFINWIENKTSNYQLSHNHNSSPNNLLNR